MNVNQQAAKRTLWVKVHTYYPGQHGIELGVSSPLTMQVACKCGWTFRTRRKQNALARHSLIQGAIRGHLVQLLIDYAKGREGT